MDWVGIIGAVLGGVGLGQIVAQYLSARQTKKELIFNNKKDAYISLIQSLKESAINPSDINAKNVGWQVPWI